MEGNDIVHDSGCGGGCHRNYTEDEETHFFICAECKRKIAWCFGGDDGEDEELCNECWCKKNEHKPGTIVGTSYFVDIGSAVNYYKPYGHSPYEVLRKLQEGEIHIGRPEVSSNQELFLPANGENRWHIQDKEFKEKEKVYLGFPRYVSFQGGSALELQSVDHSEEIPFYADGGSSRRHECRDAEEGVATYYRIAGEWEVQAVLISGKILSKSEKRHLDGLFLTEITQEEHDRDNEGYVGSSEPKLGWEEGEVCGRTLYSEVPCEGEIAVDEPEHGCTCHLGAPPCSYCVTPRESCPECGWTFRYDEKDLP